jgi:serine/threonine protein phosphatase PrpC
MQLELSVVSRAGARAVNEDAYGVWSAPSACFCVMSDGAGGHRGGQVASKMVVSRVLDWFRAAPACDPQSIGAALVAANDTLLSEQQRDAELADMHATAVVLAIDRERDVATWAHLGDSRLYRFREGRVALRTRDHSLAQQMIDTALERGRHRVRGGDVEGGAVGKHADSACDLDAAERELSVYRSTSCTS